MARLHTAFFLTCLTLGVGSCSSAADHMSKPGFDITTANAGDVIAAQLGQETTTFGIASERGIGRATIALTADTWSDRIVLRFHLGNLEHMSLRYADTRIELSVASTSARTIIQSIRNGQDEQRIAPDSRYWLNVRIVAGDGGYIDVELPDDFLDNRYGEFSIHWIDVYR